MDQKIQFVSIIIPCRNEELFIGKCLESIIQQDFPKENLEVLVIDGSSGDRTQGIVREFASKYPFIRLLENPQKFTPFGLNIGIKASQGEIIIRMDSHAGYEREYVSKCVKYLRESGADNVGGIIKTLPVKNTLPARAIAKVLSHPFGAGGSYFRIGSEEPRWVDTVFGGCYKREVFDKIGLFNEKMLRSQDIELNKRLIKAGGKILLHPDIVAYYYPQAEFWKFFEHNFTDGFWTIYPLKFKVRFFSWRHLMPLFFVLTLPLGIWPYIPISLFFSAKIALKEDLRYFFILPFVFFNRHFAYGLGSLWGMIRLIK
ncbi:MAG: glycosyltransferase family 2 protein [bacterium]|nr:glycosyltransferase family 2 protein [bacterium]